MRPKLQTQHHARKRQHPRTSLQHDQVTADCTLDIQAAACCNDIQTTIVKKVVKHWASLPSSFENMDTCCGDVAAEHIIHRSTGKLTCQAKAMSNGGISLLISIPSCTAEAKSGNYRV